MLCDTRGVGQFLGGDNYNSYTSVTNITPNWAVIESSPLVGFFAGAFSGGGGYAGWQVSSVASGVSGGETRQRTFVGLPPDLPVVVRTRAWQGFSTGMNTQSNYIEYSLTVQGGGTESTGPMLDMEYVMEVPGVTSPEGTLTVTQRIFAAFGGLLSRGGGADDLEIWEAGELEGSRIDSMDKLHVVKQWMTIFGDDDVSPIRDAYNTPYGGIVDGEVITPTFSTLYGEIRPYLTFNPVGPEFEADLLEGSSTIGSMTMEVLDKRTNPNDQGTGIMTRLLSDAEGYNQLIGRRVLIEQWRMDFTRYTKLNGVITGITQVDFVKYRVTIKDIRSREIDKRLFVRAPDYGVAPIGPFMQWGRIPQTNNYLVNRPAPMFATFQDTAGGGTFMITGGNRTLKPVQGIRTTQNIRDMLARAGTPTDYFDPFGAFVGKRYLRMRLAWRPRGSTGAFTIMENMVANTALREGQSAISTLTTNINLPADQRPVNILFVSTTGGNRPGPGQNVELYILSDGRPTKDTPLFIECTFGQLLKDCYDGKYSYLATPVRYNAERMAYLVASTPMTRVVITDVEDDLFEWVSEHIYRVLGMAPGIDVNGEIYPFSVALPGPGEPILNIPSDFISHTSTWEHPDSNLRTSVYFKYNRFYLRPQEDPSEALIDRLEGVEIVHDSRHAQSAILGLRELKFEPVTVNEIALDDKGTMAVGSELGANITRARASDTYSRWLYGQQAKKLVVSSKVPGIRDLIVGQWVLPDVPWFPNYMTHVRGGRNLSQVVRVHERDPNWFELDIIATRIYSDEIIGDDDGLLRYPPPGLSVQPPEFISGYLYASRATITSSGLGFQRIDAIIRDEGMPIPSHDDEGWFNVGLTPASQASVQYAESIWPGQDIWWRARAEGPDRAPSQWVGPMNADISGVNNIPYLISASASADADGNIFVRFTGNAWMTKLNFYVEYVNVGESSRYTDATFNSILIPESTDIISNPQWSTVPWQLTDKMEVNKDVIVWAHATSLEGPEFNGNVMDLRVIYGEATPVIMPKVTVTDAVTADVGTVTITIGADPQNRFISVETRTRAGNGEWTPYVVDALAPYTGSVNLVPGIISYVGYRVMVKGDGDLPEVLLEDQRPFQSNAPGQPIISLSIGATGIVTATITGDVLTHSIKYAVNKTAYPTTATVRAAVATPGRTLTVAEAATLLAGERLYVAAFAYGSSGLESSLGQQVSSAYVPGNTGGGGIGGVVGEFSQLVFTTPSVADGVEALGTVTMPNEYKSIVATEIAVNNKKGRLRFYGSATLRDVPGEVSRPFLTDPGIQGAVEVDWLFEDTVVAAGGLIRSDPEAIVTNRDTTRGSTIYYRWRNDTGAATTATFTLTFIPLGK